MKIVKPLGVLCVSILYSLCSSAFEYKTACGELSQEAIASEAALLLSGGAGAASKDEVPATRWLLQHAPKGDYLVIRAGGVGRQAKWICDTFPELVGSGAEISIDSREDANHPAVIKLIQSVEVIWIAGGDQNKYENYWKGSALAQALNHHMSNKPIGGTSAGMAILGSSYYAPESKAVIGSQILNNPYHDATADIFHEDLLQHPHLVRTLNETHVNRSLKGETRHNRMFGLLARTVSHFDSISVRALGLNEGSFLAIDKDGKGKVFGDELIILTPLHKPEVIKPGLALIWNHDGQAVKALRIEGSHNGAGDLDFKHGVFKGGQIEYWSTSQGNDGFTMAQESH